SADPGDAPRRDRLPRRVRRLGAARAGADAAASPVPAAELHVREPRDGRRLRSPLDAHLLPDAVPDPARRLLAVPERARDRADHHRHVRALAARWTALDALRTAL